MEVKAMALNFVIVALLFTSAVNSFRVQKIDGVSGKVRSMVFDSNFNCYIVSKVNGTDHLFKISKEKKVIFTQKLNTVKNVILNSADTAYVFEEIDNTTTTEKKVCEMKKKNGIFSNDYEDENYKDCTMIKDIHTTFHNAILIAKSNSKKLRKLFQWESKDSKIYNKQFIDPKENIFFSTNMGIWYLNSDTNVPLAVPNLIDHNLHSLVIDGNGLTYLKTENMSEATENILLIKIEKQKPLLSVDVVLKVPKDTINSFGTDQNGVVYLATQTDFQTFKSVKLTKEAHFLLGDHQLLLLQYNTFYDLLFATQDRFYFTRYVSAKYFNIYFITKDERVVAIEEIFEYPKITKDEKLCANDSIGNVYFAHEKTIILIKHNETEARRITTPTNLKISSIAVDQNDDLWVSAGKLYYFKNGTNNALWVSDLSDADESPIKENGKAGEVLVGTANGLFAYSTEV